LQTIVTAFRFVFDDNAGFFGETLEHRSKRRIDDSAEPGPKLDGRTARIDTHVDVEIGRFFATTAKGG